MATSTAAPAPSPNVAIIIYREDSCGDIDAGCTSDGRVYDITPGEPVPVCGTATVASGWDFPVDEQNETEDYSVQTPKFTSHSTFKNCQYTGTADQVGTFTCDGFPSAVTCITPAATATSCSDANSLDEDDFTPIVYCAWVSSAPAPAATTAAPAPTCTLEIAVGGKGIVTDRECLCNFSPKPAPSVVNGEYTCPDQVALIGKRSEDYSENIRYVEW